MLTVEDGEVARKARLLGRKIKWMQECFTKIEKVGAIPAEIQSPSVVQARDRRRPWDLFRRRGGHHLRL